jgi:GH25 family lysozyme M1 (1,4-beta-N-acetylmuramidase)
MALGIDIYYKYQQLRDPRAVRDSGITFAWIKALDGHNGVVNVAAALDQARALRSAGIDVGPYIFAQPGATSPEEQAERFAGVWRAGDGLWTLAPALDMEQPGGTLPYTVWSQRFIARFREATGIRRHVLYSSKSWFTGGQLAADAFDGDVVFWVARYYTNRADPATLGWGHPRLAAYQYWNAGAVPGIGGQVDLNVTVGDPARIRLEDDMPSAAEVAAEVVRQLGFQSAVPGAEHIRVANGSIALANIDRNAHGAFAEKLQSLAIDPETGQRSEFRASLPEYALINDARGFRMEIQLNAIVQMLTQVLASVQGLSPEAVEKQMRDAFEAAIQERIRIEVSQEPAPYPPADDTASA